MLAGLVLGLAAAMKATAWPALAVALVLVATRDGWRGAGWLALAMASGPAVIDGPVLIAQPGTAAVNTILFPLGLTKIHTPAASMLPGYLISRTWGWGHEAAIALVLLAGLAVAASLIARPPRDAQAAGWRLVIGVALMFLLAPATRFGYAVYPLTLSARLLLSALPSVARPSGAPRPGPAQRQDSAARPASPARAPGRTR